MISFLSILYYQEVQINLKNTQIGKKSQNEYLRIKSDQVQNLDGNCWNNAENDRCNATWENTTIISKDLEKIQRINKKFESDSPKQTQIVDKKNRDFLIGLQGSTYQRLSMRKKQYTVFKYYTTICKYSR